MNNRSFISDRVALLFLVKALLLLPIHFADGLSPAVELSPDEQEALQAARQGGLVRLEGLAARRRELPRVPLSISGEPGPQFVLSDKPEYFPANGIALQEEVKPGTVRLYLYHVPEPAAGPKTVSAVLENLGTRPLALRLLRSGVPPPGTDYPRIARAALLDFFSGQPEAKASMIPPGGRLPLDPRLEATTAVKDQLVHGFYEFELDQPARLTVFQRDPDQISTNVIDGLPLLPLVSPDKVAGNGAGRGLFSTCNLLATNTPEFALDTTNGVVQVVVADGRREGWIQGRDGIEGEPTRDAGNYGVLYRIRLRFRSGDGRGMAVLLSASSGSGRWCGRVGAAMQVSAGLWPAGTLALPSDRTSFGGPGEFVLVQKFPPRPGEQTIELVYSPPGAACIPTPLVLVPLQPWTHGPSDNR